MRKITDHIVNPCNDKLSITVIDEPGAGGANHSYRIDGFDLANNPSYKDTGHSQTATITFQNGPINDVGINGITQEVLLAIVADRLRSFQDGPFRCRENAIALTKVEEAILWLQKRTLDRMRRGVEGTHEK